MEMMPPGTERVKFFMLLVISNLELPVVRKASYTPTMPPTILPALAPNIMPRFIAARKFAFFSYR